MRQKASQCPHGATDDAKKILASRKGAAPGRDGESFPRSADRYSKMKRAIFFIQYSSFLCVIVHHGWGVCTTGGCFCRCHGVHGDGHN